jgi:hypothetical protein
VFKKWTERISGISLDEAILRLLTALCYNTAPVAF